MNGIMILRVLAYAFLAVCDLAQYMANGVIGLMFAAGLTLLAVLMDIIIKD